MEGLSWLGISQGGHDAPLRAAITYSPSGAPRVMQHSAHKPEGGSCDIRSPGCTKSKAPPGPGKFKG